MGSPLLGAPLGVALPLDAYAVVVASRGALVARVFTETSYPRLERALRH